MSSPPDLGVPPLNVGWGRPLSSGVLRIVGSGSVSGGVYGKSADHWRCQGLQAQAVPVGCVAIGGVVIGGGGGLGVCVPLDIIRQ